MNGLKKRYHQFREAKAEIVIISADSVEELDEYRTANAAPFVMLSDRQCTVIQRYGVYNPSERDGIATPAVFIVDQEGTIRHAKVERTLLRTRGSRLLKEVKGL